MVSLLINCKADINKLGFVPQNLAIDSSYLDLLSEDQKNFFQLEEQAINKYSDEIYSHPVRKPLIKYLEEANLIQQKLRENLDSDERNSQKINPYWTYIRELQKIAEHLKEKQKIICYLQNLRNQCVFLKTRH